MVEHTVLICTVLIFLCGLPAFFPLSAGNFKFIAVAQFTASIVGALAASFRLMPKADLAASSSSFAFSWCLAVDPLAAIFLVPTFLVTGAAALYGVEYCSHGEYLGKRRQIHFLLATLSASLLIIPCAKNAIVFLTFWEIMALSAFFLISSADERSEVRRAAWIYIVATHISTLALFAFFALYKSVTGSYAFDPIVPGSVDSSTLSLLYVLAISAFGLKAGLYPLHFWLPPAHAAAPSHVSAVMSGVLIKIGIYGILRCLWLLPEHPVWLGIVLMVLGAASAVLGVAHAIAQHDLKRLLAYHSVENIGIIVLGIGLGLMGITYDRPILTILGFAAGILHVWNHALFKSLLFLAGGAVIHATRVRTIDRLGGIFKRMPYSATLFLVGAVAIVGLPPLNGFVSEFVLYSGLLQGAVGEKALSGSLCAISFALLCLAGALALACFAKVFGVAFLGVPRSAEAAAAGECGTLMRSGMFSLVLACAMIGLCPRIIAPLLRPVVFTLSPRQYSAEWMRLLGSLEVIQFAALILVFCALVATLILRACLRVSSNSVPTWDCGFTLLSPRLQYSASSFAEMLTGAFALILVPRFHFRALERFFPRTASFHSTDRDPIMHYVLAPVYRGIELLSLKLRLLQQGVMQAYVFYIVFTFVAVLFTGVCLW